jgi:hypothetical protein
MAINVLAGFFDHLYLYAVNIGSAIDVLFNGCGQGLTLAFAGLAMPAGDIAGRLLANVKRWHGGIDDQFQNINNFVDVVAAHPTWTRPATLFPLITQERDKLVLLVIKCRSTLRTDADLAERNTLLKTCVELCLTQGRFWAYSMYASATMTLDDVHLLGFLLPGEKGGHHPRAEATDAIAEVKVRVISAEFIRVVIDQAAGENAALVVHGWPAGVRHALIVILAADGVTEVYRVTSTHLYNDIEMPAGSHGKQFMIKAAFLRHTDDEPRFASEVVFSMPLTTSDLVQLAGTHQREETGEHEREVERHRLEVERLQAELDAAKKRAGM